MKLIIEKAPPGYEKIIEKIHEKNKEVNKGQLIAHYWNIFNELVNRHKDRFKGLVSWVKNVKGEKRVKVNGGSWDKVAEVVLEISNEDI